ncbi:Ubiquitin-like protein 3 like protein [Argiope bruennichi]|uniref:Ubiquitin-like protein 3 like protein n=1 Tax=Argiope bruennichi TaxID=94029 RepID=A0A8T0F553_ARGBR|nr:Ubiquitin-like protein 3 like protein [Argiope bruennichi]
MGPCPDIAQYVFDNWVEAEWAEESVAKAEILRLIYQGRFLHGNVTLGALQLPLGRTTVMHLVPRENLPEPNSQDQRQKSKDRSNYILKDIDVLVLHLKADSFERSCYLSSLQ